MAPKRRVERATSPIRPPTKRAKQEVSNDHNGETRQLNYSQKSEEIGVVNRTFYPSEMSNERCEMYNKDQIPRPIELLQKALQETKSEREQVVVGECVVHWFKRDLRLFDNRALKAASERARKHGIPLVCLFVISPQDYEAHNTAAARVDFELRTLAIMKEDLSELDIPLVVQTVEKRKDVLGWIIAKCQEWRASHLFCNMEYEVDELRREARLVRNGITKGIAVEVLHDDVVVPPGDLATGGGKQYSVYSPWYRSWVKHIHGHEKLLVVSETPERNPSSVRARFSDLFEVSIPSAPENKSLSPEQREHYTHLYPAGEHEAHARLERFLSQKISAYKDTRNIPSANSTSHLSVHFSTGTLSTRTAIRAARNVNTAKALDAGNLGVTTWISELGWRDFYKHVLVHWPYVCMAKPFKYEYSDIEWEYNDAHFAAWCEGKTGFPIVDAAMRQLLSMAWVHNRCRMIVASFLAKDLLLDWRLGEKYFMANLIDADFGSNNGGWGFSASTGVDPQPYFRIFNPLLQSEKFDPKGEYIRKWVPELRNIEGAAIHAPWERCKGPAMKDLEKSGYPKPMVVHKDARERALQRYKTGLGRSTANVGGGVHN